MGDQSNVNQFIEQAVSGDTREAVGFAIQLLDTGWSKVSIIDGVLAPAQREVGARWQRGELGVADEHLASNVAETALYALASELPMPDVHGLVVVACAPGDWHSIAGHMFAEGLHASGVATTFLGASTPAADVSRYLVKHRPNALAVSCAMPLFFSGVTELADAAHSFDIPVIAGGRAFAEHPEWAMRVGSDAYAPDVTRALEILATWEVAAPPLALGQTLSNERLATLDTRASEFAASAFHDASTRVGTFARYTSREAERAKENLAYMVRFVAAALYVDDTAVFTNYLSWLVDLMGSREVTKSAVLAGLESLRAIPELRGGDIGATFDTGAAFLAESP